MSDDTKDDEIISSISPETWERIYRNETEQLLSELKKAREQGIPLNRVMTFDDYLIEYYS